ncbi:MAG: hypothetical protein HY062_07855 [Bacteroidetes bacterium]|nr:hypothetical protein [Bacteroidota bacterium]
MKYTLNIESSYRSNIFRLTQNKYWAPCADVTVINEDDYCTTNRIDIVSQQRRNVKITIDSGNFEIHPEMGTELGNENQLHYEIYGFRQTYPTPPDENQLMDLLINGNDDVRNILILKTDGIFYLLQQHQILDYASNPEYVVQFEGFQASNGYVGSSINDNHIRNYVQNLFRIGIFHWVNHLKFKILHDQADIQIHPNDQVPEILALFDELHQIQTNWKPDY